MRLLLFLLAICAGIVWIGAHAEAQNYPWCAQYGSMGGLNCGFTMPGHRDWYGRVLRSEYAVSACSGIASINRISTTLIGVIAAGSAPVRGASDEIVAAYVCRRSICSGDRCAGQFGTPEWLLRNHPYR